MLGLNVAYLVSRRKSIITEYLDDEPEDLEAELHWLKSMHDGEFEEFCFVLEQYVAMLLANQKELVAAV